MKHRSTVFWPEKNIGANEVVDTAAADAKCTAEEMAERVKLGFAVEHVEPDPNAEPAGGAHSEPAAEADKPAAE